MAAPGTLDTHRRSDRYRGRPKLQICTLGILGYLFNVPVSAVSLWSSLALSAFFLVLGALHLGKLELGVMRRNETHRPHTGSAGALTGTER